MERKGRNDLKEIFSRGSLPTESNFRTLIDSLLNLEDDDFQSLLDGPLKIYSTNDKESPGSKKTVLEFFKSPEDTTPIWKFKLDIDEVGQESLQLVNQKDIEILSITPKGEVVVNSKSTRINGAVSLAELYGNYGENDTCKVPANGEWHSILKGIIGCQSYEVIARAGNKYAPKSEYAMTKGTALLVPSKERPWDFLFPEKNKIQMLQNYSGSSRNKIDLRWKRVEYGAFDLQVRTRKDYKGNTKITCILLKTFSDDFMEEDNQQN